MRRHSDCGRRALKAVAAARLLTLVCILAVPVTVHASWTVVSEDSLFLPSGISSLNLDTAHFDEPALLLGTHRDSAGQSCLLLLRAGTFEILDTIYQGYFSPTVCKVADINHDGDVDYALAVASEPADSTAYAGILLVYGPDQQIQATLPQPSPVRDLAIDTSRHEFWVARLDRVARVDTGITNIQALSYTSGKIGSWGFDLQPHDSVDDTLGGLAIQIRDINSDGVENVVAVWNWNQSWSCSGCFHAPAQDEHECGAIIIAAGQDAPEQHSWLHLEAPFGREQLYNLNNAATFPMADLDGDGMDEAVYSWMYTMNERPYFTQYQSEVQIRSLLDGGLVWSKAYPANGYGPFTCILYPLDGDGLPDLLISLRYDWGTTSGTLMGIRGTNGDSLFSIPFRTVRGTVAPAFREAGENPNVIEARSNWLHRWRLESATEAGGDPSTTVPESYVLESNVPNPFNPTTVLAFKLPQAGTVRLEVFNALGQQVANLANGHFQAGRHEVQWNARGMASGVYFYRLQAGAEVQTRSMMLLK